ncbi:hypothetical protein [Bacillus pumilus]|uniref:hypothetical protein n=1 Tax=Bacillus pumilus TaxID=1408 RepID=UPI003CFC6DF6
MLDKKISIGHFVYTTIIALLIITFILVFAFGDNKDAGNQVNVMATGISIILAVIAILMTLVDVAGQRQSIIDIKETAEKLMKNQKASDDALEKSIETLEFLSSFREEMLASVSEFKDLTEERLTELLSKETIEKSDLDMALKDISRETSQLNSKLRLTPNSAPLNNTNAVIESHKKIIRKLYPNDDVGLIKLSQVKKRLYKYPESTSKYILYSLKRTGNIEVNTEDGEEYANIKSFKDS